MSSSRPSPQKPPRIVRVLGLAVAGVLGFFALNTLQNVTANDAAADVSAQSLLTIGGSQDAATPTAVPTTAPLQLPTATALPATPEPTPTSAPTVAPTAEALPTATSEPAPVQNATAIPTAEVSSSRPAPAAPAEVEPTSPAAVEPTAPPAPTAEPTAVAPTATAVPPTPEPTPTRFVPAGTPEPPLSATATPTVEPTATPEPTPVPLRTVAELESYVLGEINGVRAAAGLGPIALDPTVSAISRDWSQQMAAGGFFEHRNGDQLSAMLPAGWRRWGENIASAHNILWAQSSLEQSPGHYANMVSPHFTHVGIGVYQADGQVWVTQNFVQY